MRAWSADPEAVLVPPATATDARSPAAGAFRLFCWVLVGYGAGAVAAWWLINQSDLSAVLFPPAGVTIAALVMNPRRRWWVVYLAAATAELAVNATLGDTPFTASIGFVAANLAEPTVAALLLVATNPRMTGDDTGPTSGGHGGQGVDLARRYGLARFVAAAIVVGPAAGATIGAAVASLGLGADFLEIWPNWWLGDALGVTLVGAAILVWRARLDARPPTHPLALVLLATSAALTVGIIVGSDLPVLFVVLIGIIVAGAQFGARTVAVHGLAIAAIIAVAFAWDPDGLIMNLAPDSALVVVKLQLLLFVIAGYVVAAEATDRTLAAARAATEQQTVDALHRLLLPPRHLAGPRFTATGIYQAAATNLGVGGDWYDVITLPDQRVLITVGDVVGHNDSAARAMARIRAILPAIAATANTPAQVVDQLDADATLNRDLFAATTWIGLYQPADGTLTYSSAGHPPGYLLTPSGALHQLDQGGSTPLGVTSPNPRPCAATTISHPSTIVLYTDGLIERRRQPLDHGLAHLEQLLTTPNITPETVIADMLSTSDNQDDTVLLWVDLKPTPEPSIDVNRSVLADQTA